MNQDLLRGFKNPGCEYRGAPFWAWNGKLEPVELRRQIRLMRRMGLGGFFMHSRVGLATEYLSADWFRCVDACVDEARKLGMKAWLYDEDRWPSGAAGGIVTRHPAYAQRSLVLRRVARGRELQWRKHTLAAFTAVREGKAARCIRRIPKGKRPRVVPEGGCILVLSVEPEEPSSWYNGCTYLDTLSAKAVRRFIEVTHEAYRRHCAEHFGRTVPGIFTDEPNHGSMMAWRDDAVRVPWTDRLPRVFRQRYGYDLVARLPEVFFDVDGKEVSPARVHYHDCVTHLFVDAFARQIGEWCHRNGMLHTGHVLAEPTLSSQTGVAGSCMRFYEHMQAPGMDILTEHEREYDTAKQVSSAARQFGRKWRLTETYGCTGWDFPFAGHKAIGDWQVALGINLRCQHLSWYTMEGQAKRDYPASISTQSPWWSLYPKVEDYFARVHAVMTRGREVRDLLVIHPVESMWAMCHWRYSDDPQVKEYDKVLPRLRDALLAANIDFDYGDEEILSRHARVNREGAATLRVGRAAYRAVIVPPLKTVRRTTLDLLERFRKAGGLVVFAGEACDFVDAVPARDARRLAERCEQVPFGGNAVVDAVAAVCRRVSIHDAAGAEIPDALHLLREDGDNFYLFVCNTGHDFRRARGDIPVRERTDRFPDVRILAFRGCLGVPLECDPETGEIFRADARRRGSAWEVRTQLSALGSRLFVAPKKRVGRDGKYPRREALREVRRVAVKGNRWDVALSEPNCLVLDRAQYRIAGGRWRAEKEVLRIDSEIRRVLGVPERGGRMCQPWAADRKARAKRVAVELRYAFQVKAVPSGELFLAVEKPERYGITVNGRTVTQDMANGWWTDRSLRRLPLETGSLGPGQNELRLQCRYSEYDPGLELVYVLGMFGTEISGPRVALTSRPTWLRIGDWTAQGLCFYSGSVTYVRRVSHRVAKGERLFVEVPDYRGTAVRVTVDGEVAGVIGWEPNEVEVTRWANGGEFELGIEVVGHRRNSHGPLHHAEKRPPWTGPGEFVTKGKRWADGYQLVPCGLMSPPYLVVKR